MASFEKIIKITKEFEGKYSNHRADRGGETMWGITKWRAISSGYFGRMRNMPLTTAYDIYEKYYWKPLRLDSVKDEYIALVLFDIKVNGGHAGKWLQRCLNVLNREQRDWADLKVDGKVGPQTIGVLNIALATVRGQLNFRKLLATMLEGIRTTYFIEISEKRAKNEAFTAGWIWNRVIKLAENFSKLV